MSFINLEIFKKTFPNLGAMITADNAPEFEEINSTVDKFIADRAGIGIANTPDGSPDWIRTPAVFLCYYFFLSRIDNPTDELIRDAQFKYEEACRILDRHTDIASNKVFISGQIKKEQVW